MAKHIAYIKGLNKAFKSRAYTIPDTTDQTFSFNPYNINDLKTEKGVDKNTVLFITADTKDEGGYILIRDNYHLISEGDAFIVTQNDVFAVNYLNKDTINVPGFKPSYNNCLSDKYLLWDTYFNILNSGRPDEKFELFGADDIKEHGVYQIGLNQGQSAGTLYVLVVDSGGYIIQEVEVNSLSFNLPSTLFSRWVRIWDGTEWGEFQKISYEPKGTQGATGQQSSAGTQGATGLQGATGVGVQGVTGIQGVTGTQGATGAKGIQGATGSKGAPGENANTIVFYDGKIEDVYNWYGGSKIGDLVIDSDFNIYVCEVYNSSEKPGPTQH